MIKSLRIFLICAFALATACGDRGTDRGPGVSFGAPSPTSRSSPSPVDEDSLFAFTAPAIMGGQVVGSELVGKDVAIWSWAPW